MLTVGSFLQMLYVRPIRVDQNILKVVELFDFLAYFHLFFGLGARPDSVSRYNVRENRELREHPKPLEPAVWPKSHLVERFQGRHPPLGIF